MSRFLLLSLVLLFIHSGTSAQSVFSFEFMSRLQEASIGIVPGQTDYIDDNYRSVNKQPIEGSKVKWQTAVQHKTKKISFYFNVEPEVVYLVSFRAQGLIEDCGCEKVEAVDNTEGTAGYFRAKVLWRSLGRNCSSHVADYTYAAFIVMNRDDKEARIYTHFEVLVFFDDLNDYAAEVNDVLRAFKFIPNESEYMKEAGLGLTFGYNRADENWQVRKVAMELPAYEAGIRPGDVISSIDGYSLIGLDYYDVFMRLGGEDSTEVVVKVNRYGCYFNYTVQRGIIERDKQYALLAADSFDHLLYSICEATYIYMRTDQDILKGEFQDDGFGIVSTYEAGLKMAPGVEGIFTDFTMFKTQSLTYEIFTGTKEEMESRYEELRSWINDYFEGLGFSESDHSDIGRKHMYVSMIIDDYPFITISLEASKDDPGLFIIELDISYTAD